jgi:hypothetical protein
MSGLDQILPPIGRNSIAGGYCLRRLLPRRVKATSPPKKPNRIPSTGKPGMADGGETAAHVVVRLVITEVVVVVSVCVVPVDTVVVVVLVVTVLVSVTGTVVVVVVLTMLVSVVVTTGPSNA